MMSLFKKLLSLRSARFLLFIPLISIIASCGGSDSGSSSTDDRNLNTQPFITTWKTDNAGQGEDLQVVIPADSNSYAYNFNVNWGDGSSDSNLSESIVHTYDTAGTYTITISGQFPRITFNGDLYHHNEKLLSVEQWGGQKWQSMKSAFAFCTNLQINASDAPNLSKTTDMQAMFYSASAMNKDINNWNVSAVTDMSWLFNQASSFNQKLDAWNVSSVTDMAGMFYDAIAFNQDISAWDVSSVTDMSGMFHTATAFNQDISAWTVSSVTNMSWMFFEAAAFNQDVSVWDTTSLTSTDLELMFEYSGISDDNFNLISDTWAL